MRINVDPGSMTTFTRFDNIAFSSGTGAQFLQIYGKTLYLRRRLRVRFRREHRDDDVAVTALAATGRPAPPTRPRRGPFSERDLSRTTGRSGPATELPKLAAEPARPKSDDDGTATASATRPASERRGGAILLRGPTTRPAPSKDFPPRPSTGTRSPTTRPTSRFTTCPAPSIAFMFAAQPARTGTTGTRRRDENIIGTPRWLTSGSMHYRLRRDGVGEGVPAGRRRLCR